MHKKSKTRLSQQRIKRIGYIRVFNDADTVIPCLLSVAPVLDHIVVIWSEECANLSILRIREWAEYLLEQYNLKLTLARYPHSVLPPHSVDDLRVFPVENRMDGYSNFGMDIIKSLYPDEEYLAVKIDSDQVYFTREFEEALTWVTTMEDSVSLQGYNTLIKDDCLYLYRPRPANGGVDHLACGNRNLSSFGCEAYYEVDITPHPRMKSFPRMCWMHFMRTARLGNTIRLFREEEILPVSADSFLLSQYEQQIVPLFDQANSLYSSLKTGRKNRGKQEGTVCIVSNKRIFERDYSEFVDSCDVVIRINKMDNLDSGLTGSRTTLAVVSACQPYLQFSRETRHMDILHQAQHIYFNKETWGLTRDFAEKENFSSWSFLPQEVEAATTNYTTLSMGLALAIHLYPDSRIYYLGDRDSEVRAPNTGKHPYAEENAFLNMLILFGMVIPVLEDGADKYQFSEPVNQDKKKNLAQKRNNLGLSSDKEYVVEVKHDIWSDVLRIQGDRAYRTNAVDAATIRQFDKEILSLDWDNWGSETFVKGSSGKYELQ